MQRVSSNTTLLLKIFLPTIYISFFGALAVAIILADPGDLPMTSTILLKSIFVACYLVFVLFLTYTFMNLKRVEVDYDFLYVSNYFKTYRYKLEDVEHIHTVDLFIFTIASLHMKDKTKMGKKIRFIAKMKYLRPLLEDTSFPLHDRWNGLEDE